MNSIKVNIAKMKGLKGISIVMMSSLLVTGLSACASDNKKCYVSGNHAHMYVSDDGLVRYIMSEKGIVDGYRKSCDYKEIDEDDIALYRFMQKKGISRIDDNIDQINMQQTLNKPFTIYEYIRSAHLRVTLPGEPNVTYAWTNDPEHRFLTGEEKEVHFIYQAFDIVEDGYGNYVLVSSPFVEDITEIMDDYPYIMDDYYTAVDENNVVVSFNDDLKARKQESIETSEEYKTLKKMP